MDEFKVGAYGRRWDGFLCESLAWEFHVVVWDWYDQWRELDLLRLHKRSIRICEPSRNRYNVIETARLYGDHKLEREIQARVADVKYG